jgi:hypothetical protein
MSDLNRLQTITYNGDIVALAGPNLFILEPEIDALAVRDPLRTMVVYMCAYARDVIAGVLPGPYTDHDARRYACACLLPDELLERDNFDIDRASRYFQIPADDIAHAQREHRPRGAGAGHGAWGQRPQ